VYGELVAYIGKRVLQGYNMRRITNKRNTAMCCVCEEERERRGSIHSASRATAHPPGNIYTPLSLSL
jgi:hypothetical protein